jgi:hypothetical protein
MELIELTRGYLEAEGYTVSSRGRELLVGTRSVRDSLLATNEELREFCDEYDYAATIYELEQWGRESKRQFATIALGAAADTDATLVIL